MSTDNRGRPLRSQGGAIPHLNRRALTDEQVYGEGAKYYTPDEKEDIIRYLMGEPLDDASGFKTPLGTSWKP